MKTGKFSTNLEQLLSITVSAIQIMGYNRKYSPQLYSNFVENNNNSKRLKNSNFVESKN